MQFIWPDGHEEHWDVLKPLAGLQRNKLVPCAVLCSDVELRIIRTSPEPHHRALYKALLDLNCALVPSGQS